jgi:hypothetical protein
VWYRERAIERERERQMGMIVGDDRFFGVNTSSIIQSIHLLTDVYDGAVGRGNNGCV